MTRVCFLLLAVAATFQSLWNLTALHFLERAQIHADLLLSKQVSLFPEESRLTFSALEETWAKARAVNPLDANAAFSLGRAQMLRSTTEGNVRNRITLMCKALKNFERAISASPHQAPFRVAWADAAAQFKSQLSDQRQICADQGVTISATPDQLLKSAQSLAPYNGRDLYLIALVYLSLGEKSKALELLSKTQAVNPLFSKEQREFTYSLVVNEDELRLALPRRYPEIIYWMQAFSRERPEDFRTWRESFRAALSGALDELENRFRGGKITPEYFSAFIKNIAALPLAQMDDPLRRHIDTLLSRAAALEHKDSWSILLAKRSKMARIPVLKAEVTDDLLPERGMLAAWSLDEHAQETEFDSIGSSLGFYRGINSPPVRLIVMESQGFNAKLKKDAVSIYVSDDNLNYHRISESHYEFEAFFVDGKDRIAIDFHQPVTNKYIKLHYLAGNQRSRFINVRTAILQVYG